MNSGAESSLLSPSSTAEKHQPPVGWDCSRIAVSSGKASVAESRCGMGESGSAESSRERDRMRGMVGRRRLMEVNGHAPSVVDNIGCKTSSVARSFTMTNL